MLHFRFISLIATAACLLVSCARKPPAGAFVDPAFGPLIPPDTRYMAGIRLDKIRETGLYKRLNGRYDLERRLNLFSERTGIDPNKDLWQVLMASNGTDTLFLARGRFTSGELEPKLGTLGSQRTKYRDYTLIGTPDTSIVFLNPGVAAAGPQDLLRKLIDHRADWTEMPEEFATRLRSMPAGDQAWVISESGLPKRMIGGPDTTGAKSMIANLLGFVSAGYLALHMDEGAELRGEVNCVSAEGAQRVRDAVKGGIGMARLSVRDDQMQLLKLYDTVQVEQKDKTVHLAARVAPDLVGPLLKMLPAER